MRILYIDLLSGAAGDMLLASLIDMGFPVNVLEAELAKLPIEKIELHIEKTARSGITGTKLTPHLGHAHEHRHLEDILSILRAGSVSPAIYAKCAIVLDRLAEAESKVHGIPKDHVHFHEIGALDTIVDILGFCMALEYFKIDQLCFSTLTDGNGSIKAAHGIMPVPVPATAVMIQGFVFKSLPISTELLTPTGAALLTALGEQRPEGCEGKIVAMGYGCGTKVFEHHPNFLRATLFETAEVSGASFTDKVMQLESDMDHISGEVMGDTANRLLEAGALDASWVPVFMKKGRPGFRLTVIAKEKDAYGLADMIIRQTRSLGVRVHKVDRVIAERSSGESLLLNESCKEKHCTFKGYTFTKPEYESLAGIARKKNLSVIDVMEAYVKQQK